jgi:hypothetical protein
MTQTVNADMEIIAVYSKKQGGKKGKMHCILLIILDVSSHDFRLPESLILHSVA